MIDNVKEQRYGQAAQSGCVIEGSPRPARLAIRSPVSMCCLFHGVVNVVYSSGVVVLLFTDAKLGTGSRSV